MQLIQCPAQMSVVVGIGEGKCGLVGTAHLCPEFCRLGPLARDFQSVWLGRVGWDLTVPVGAPAPAGQLTDCPRRLPSERELERAIALSSDRVVAALEPASFSSRDRGGSDALQLARRLRQSPRLVEQRPDFGIPAACPDEPQYGKCVNPWDRPGAGMAQDYRGGVGGFVQSTFVKLQPGAAGQKEQPPEVETALGAVLEPGFQEALYEQVVPTAYRPPDEVDECSADVILQTRAPPE